MKHSQIILIATVIVALAGTPIFAQQLLPAGASDLSAETLTAAPRLKGVSVPREAVALSWPLAEGTALSIPAPHVSQSQEYLVDVTAADLVAGVPVYTSAPGALVRLNPAAGADAGVSEKAAIVPASLVLIDAAGKSWGGGSGMDLMVGPEQLKTAGAPFAPGTSAFRIREELGAGAFELRAEGLAASGERYVVHVFDRASTASLELTTGSANYLHGQTLTVEATLVGASARTVEGFVTSPAGRAWPLSFRLAGKEVAPQAGQRTTYRARLTLDAVEMPAPGLWEVHASAEGRAGGHAVLRAGRTAFACAVPSARFSGAAEVVTLARLRRDVDGLGFRLGVEAASAGRYEARGVLWATAADGTLRPAGVAHSAAWLEAGSGALELAFDREILDRQQLGAPFELRDLRLIDQVSMGLLHRQERALAVGR